MAQYIALILLGAAALASAAAMKADFVQHLEACRASYPVDDKVIGSLHMKGILPDETDENARCHVQCLMTKIGPLVDSDGKFDSSAARANLLKQPVFFGPPGTKMPAQDRVDVVVEECAPVTGDGKCMTSYKIWACIYAKFHQG